MDSNGTESDGGPFLFAIDLTRVDGLTERLANVQEDALFNRGQFPIAFVLPWQATDAENAAMRKQMDYFEKNTLWKPGLVFDPHPAFLAGFAEGWWGR